MKTIHALFLMGLIFGGMPVIAGEDSGDEDDGLIREVLDEELSVVLAARRIASEQARLRVAQPAAREQAALQAAQKAAMEAADFELARRLAMEEEDSDVESDEDSDDPDASAGYGRQTAHGRPCGGPRLRKPGCYGGSTLPAYVATFSSDKNPTKKVMRNKILQPLRYAMSRVTNGKLTSERMRKNIGMIRCALPVSEFYNKCDERQRYIILQLLKKSEEKLASLEKASEESKRLKTGEGAPRRRNSMYPGYVTYWNDYKNKGLQPSEAFEKISELLVQAKSNAWLGIISVNTFKENLEEMRRVMPGSPLHGQLSQEQRDAIEEKLKNAEKKFGELLGIAQRRDLREAQSGGMPKRLKPSGGGAAAGGGGGGGSADADEGDTDS